MTKSVHRIDVADALRGLSVLGIVLVHSLENYNLFNFTPIDTPFMKFLDSVLFDSTFFIFAGKAYGIFALLFGFSFFIQDNNQLKRGNDFRPRFLWRLVLLFVWGMINSLFYTGDVLVMFSLIGIVLILTARLSTKTVLIIATIFILQPIEWGRVVYALVNPDYVMGDSMVGYHYGKLNPILIDKSASLSEIFNVMLHHGEWGSFMWAWENGRFCQVAGLFLFGMLIGRTEFFLHPETNIRKWVRMLILGVVCFFPLKGLTLMLPGFIENKAVLEPLGIIVQSFANVSFLFFLVSLVLIVYYSTEKGQSLLRKLIPYGKMSLTNYITQSLLGGTIFYSWGLGLSVSITMSFLIGVGIFIVQYIFSCWWMKNHKHGPLEYIWKKATWIGSKKD